MLPLLFVIIQGGTKFKWRFLWRTLEDLGVECPCGS